MNTLTCAVNSADSSIFGSTSLYIEKRPSGDTIISAPFEGSVPRCLGEHLVRWAKEAPDRVFLAERSGAGWNTLTYAETLRRVERIAAGLLCHNLSVERPVLLLSDNSLRFALLSLAAMHIGVPAASASPAYSLVSQDFEKLRHVLKLTTPGLIYAESGAAYRRAFDAVDVGGAVIVTGHEGFPGTLDFEDLAAHEDAAQVKARFDAVGPDTIAKFLFTSGSTGVPKAVINTQSMLCSNQEAKVRVWPFMDREPPVVVDWLPWNHTFGANYVFNTVLRNGGSLYIDAGRPTPAGIKATVEALKSVSPTIYFNVPRGYDMLLPYLESDEELCASFLKHLRLFSYAGAALPAATRDRLKKLKGADGRSIPVVASLGTTETAPGTITCYGEPAAANVVGLPMPGISLKLTPNGGKLEVRVRGPNVTPGYWRQPEITQAAFDEEGFYKVGDALRFVDESRPELGLQFDGRVSENFKLLTGTWVSVGTLRIALVSACAPFVQDAVITGHDRNAIGALLFLNPEACRRALDISVTPDAATLAADPRVRAALAAGLKSLAATAGGSSQAVQRALVLLDPPSLDAGEITDKGYINQRAVLDARAEKVSLLYAEPCDGAVITLGDA
jgi:feruloyl-CoA synthase